MISLGSSRSAAAERRSRCQRNPFAVPGGSLRPVAQAKCRLLSKDFSDSSSLSGRSGLVSIEQQHEQCFSFSADSSSSKWLQSTHLSTHSGSFTSTLSSGIGLSFLSSALAEIRARSRSMACGSFSNLQAETIPASNSERLDCADSIVRRVCRWCESTDIRSLRSIGRR